MMSALAPRTGDCSQNCHENFHTELWNTGKDGSGARHRSAVRGGAARALEPQRTRDTF